MIETTSIQDLAARRRAVVGRSRSALTTPALVLDLERTRGNIRRMADAVASMRVALRPHVKVHKSPELAMMQIDAGAIGVCTATCWEALAMARAAIPDVFVANEVVGAAKVAVLVAAARHTALSVAVDAEVNARELSRAFVEADAVLGVLIDVDTGMGRCGVRDAAEAVALARVIDELPALRLLGVSGYEGHCMLEPQREPRAREANRSLDVLLDVVDALENDGHSCELVSAGGTGTYDITGSHPRVTEIQAGSYAVMDTFHDGLVDGFEIALTVAATVVSRHGDLAVLDSGRKAIGMDVGIPRPLAVAGETLFVNEEHLGLRLHDDESLDVGDQVELVSGYAPATVNLYDVMHVVEADNVVDLWPVHGRYGSLTLV